MRVETIGVVGAGTMGRGIAQAFAVSQFAVRLYDVDDSARDAAVNDIERRLDRDVERARIEPEQRDTALGLLDSVTELAALGDTDIVIEAVFESHSIKEPIFRELDNVCRPEVILASNTSGLSISALASATTRPEKVAGMHFFNPAPVMELVEVVRGLLTNEETIETIVSLTDQLGKTPILVQESPGHLVNRLLGVMLNEAAWSLMDGIASAKEIDEAMKLGCGHTMGPLATADLIGLDVCLSLMETLHEEFGEDKYRPCPLLRQMVRAGRLGRKTSQGFFNYD